MTRRRFTPEEDAILRPYVGRVCDWRAVMGHLRHRGLGAARRRLVRLRREAGTLWRIDQAEKARNQPRAGGRFV